MELEGHMGNMHALTSYMVVGRRGRATSDNLCEISNLYNNKKKIMGDTMIKKIIYCNPPADLSR